MAACFNQNTGALAGLVRPPLSTALGGCCCCCLAPLSRVRELRFRDVLYSQSVLPTSSLILPILGHKVKLLHTDGTGTWSEHLPLEKAPENGFAFQKLHQTKSKETISVSGSPCLWASVSPDISGVYSRVSLGRF